MKKLLLTLTFFLSVIFISKSQTPVEIVSWPLTTNLSGIANYPGITPHDVEFGSGVVSEGVNQTVCGCTGLRTRDWNQATSINTSQTGGHWVQFSFTNNGTAPVVISRFGFSGNAGRTNGTCNESSAMAVRWSIDNAAMTNYFTRLGPCGGELLYMIGNSNSCINYSYTSTNTGNNGGCTTPFPISVGVGQRVRFRVIVGSIRHNTNWKVVIGNVFFERISPLAVELNDFNASCQSNGTQLNWSTLTEQNASHFDIERSNDTENWQKVGTVPASGNSSSLNTYTYSDPVRNLTTSYYRLRQVDFDGAEAIHRSVAVDCEAENSFIIYPNPSNGDFSVEITSEEVLEEAAVVVYDISGKQIQRKDLNHSMVGSNMISFSNTKMEKGAYLIVIESKNKNNFKPEKLVIN